MLHLGVISIMPDMFAALEYGIVGRTIAEKRLKVSCWDPRNWALPPHQQVDDRPYGGGPGMVMMYEPLHAAIKCAQQALGASCKTVYLSPQGMRVNQAYLTKLVDKQTSILFVAGRYEGVDERILMTDIDEEWSLGDFVLSGGEFAAMVFIDALARLLPGALGHPLSANEDSFAAGLLDHPHYTRPASVNGYEVPAVLLQGNHAAITKWRRKQALGQTWLKRPDLLYQTFLTDLDEQLLVEFKNEYGRSFSNNQDHLLEE